MSNTKVNPGIQESAESVAENVELTVVQKVELEVKTKDTASDVPVLDKVETASSAHDEEKVVTIKDVFMMFGNRKFQLLIPQLWLRSLMAATQFGFFVTFWISLMANNESMALLPDNKKMETAVYTFIFYGFGSIVGSAFFGQFLDKFGARASIVFIQGLLIVFVGLLIVQNEVGVFNWTVYLTMFGMGASETCIWCFNNIIFGFEFETKKKQFGAQLFVVESSLFTIFIVMSYFPLETKHQFREYLIFLLSLSFFALGLVYFKFPFKKQNK